MKNLYYLLALLLLLAACQETPEVDVTIDEPIYDPPTMLVQASFQGIVVDENKSPVEGAEVLFEETRTLTDSDGFFQFSDLPVYADGTHFTVTKSGYFTGSKKFDAVQNDEHKIEIELIPKELSGTLSPGQGGSIDAEVADIEFPSGTYRTESGGAYNGEVNVYAAYLDPTEEETFAQMPGDLTGVDTDGEVQGLMTFGMLAVELEDAEGNQILLPEGAQATLSMPVPNELISEALATIPLWYFNEEQGTWVEEGFADLVDGNYVGDVSHFSFWNCDAPFPLITISGTVLLNDEPVYFGRLKISDTAAGISSYGYTNLSGMYSGKVPQDKALELTMFDVCGTAVETFNIGPFSTDTDGVDVEVDVALSDFTVAGTINDCSGSVPEVAWVVVEFDGGRRIVDVASDGTFDYVFTNCSVADVSLVAVDAINGKQSDPVVISSSGSQNVGTLVACEDYEIGNTVVLYENMNWGLINSADGLISDYRDTPISSDVTKYTITVLDWMIADFVEFDIIVSDSSPDEGSYSGFTMMDQGFEISGTASVEFDSDGKLLRVTDTTDEIEVTDTSTYPGGVTEVFFDIKFP